MNCPKCNSAVIPWWETEESDVRLKCGKCKTVWYSERIDNIYCDLYMDFSRNFERIIKFMDFTPDAVEEKSNADL